MDEDDWASDGDDVTGLGDISDIPAPILDTHATEAANPQQQPLDPHHSNGTAQGRPHQSNMFANASMNPPPNAWGSASKSGDVRASLARIRAHPAPVRGDGTVPPQRRGPPEGLSSPQLFHSGPPNNNHPPSFHNHHMHNRSPRSNLNNNAINPRQQPLSTQIKELQLQPSSPSSLNNMSQQQPTSPLQPALQQKGGSIFVSNLPFESTQADIAAFFTSVQAPPADIRIFRHQDTGKVRAAVITLMPETSLQYALSLHGTAFAGRLLNVRVDSERGGSGDHHRRRNHNQQHNHHALPGIGNKNMHPHHSGERGATDRLANLSNFSGAGGPPPRSPRLNNRSGPPPGSVPISSHRTFPGRGTYQFPPASQSDGSLAPLSSSPDHAGISPGSLNPSSIPMDGAPPHSSRRERRGQQDGNDRRTFSRKGGGGVGSTGGNDPTIPTGPIPSGRKKLELKPRTKPLPVLEIDQRLIDGPSKTPSAPPGIRRPASLRNTPSETSTSPHSNVVPTFPSITNSYHHNNYSIQNSKNSTNNNINYKNSNSHTTAVPAYTEVPVLAATTAGAPFPANVDPVSPAVTAAAVPDGIKTSGSGFMKPKKHVKIGKSNEMPSNDNGMSNGNSSVPNDISLTPVVGNTDKDVVESNTPVETGTEGLGSTGTMMSKSGNSVDSVDMSPPGIPDQYVGENRPNSDRVSTSRRPSSERFTAGGGRPMPERNSSARESSKNGRHSIYDINNTNSTNDNNEQNEKVVPHRGDRNSNNKSNRYSRGRHSIYNINNTNSTNDNNEQNEKVEAHRGDRNNNNNNKSNRHSRGTGVAKEKDNERPKSFKSVNPFDALKDDVDGDDIDL